MNRRKFTYLKATLSAALISLLLVSCASLKPKGSSPSDTSSGITANEPYYPTSFGDFEVPGELKLVRKNTLFINTQSFTGGIVNLTGRVEVSSLTDFFVNSMQKNGWKITGEVRYENVLLAFTKPNKNCLISIYDGDFSGRTKVYVYITEDVMAKKAVGGMNY